MKKLNALFIGMYPNIISPYRNVFFQNLIFAMADMGVDCTVISPVPLTKYGLKTRSIKHMTIHETSKGSRLLYIIRHMFLLRQSKLETSIRKNCLKDGLKTALCGL